MPGRGSHLGRCFARAQAQGIDRQMAVRPRERGHRTDTARRGQELLRRVDLPGSQRQQQGIALRPRRGVVQRVAGQQAGRSGRAIGPGFHPQLDLGMPPLHHGQRLLDQTVLLPRLGPGHEAAVVQTHGRFDAGAAARELDRTVLAHQPGALGTAVHADHRPVVLGPQEGTRQVAARQGARQLGHGGIAVGPLARVAQLDLGRLAPFVTQAQPAPLLLAQEERTPRLGRQQLPAPVVLRHLHARGRTAGKPQAVELAQAAVVQRQLAGTQLAQGRRPGGRGGFARAQVECANAQRPGAPALLAGHHDELQELRAVELAIRRGPPGEIDMPALEAHLGQRVGQGQRGAVDPPDVVAAGVHELDLHIVAAALPLEWHRQREVGRPVRRQLPAHDGIAGDTGKVVVQAQAVITSIAAQAGLDLVGGAGLPAGRVLHVVENGGGARSRQKKQGRAGMQTQERQHPHASVPLCLCGPLACRVHFTLPINNPCM